MDIKSLPLELRLELLEQLVQVLARGILQHEYAKDLGRFNTEEVCKELANNGDLYAALRALARDDDGGAQAVLERIDGLPVDASNR